MALVDVKSVGKMMLDAATDQGCTDPAACRQQALKWTWDAAAEKLVAAVEKRVSPVRVTTPTYRGIRKDFGSMKLIGLAQTGPEGDMGHLDAKLRSRGAPCYILSSSRVVFPEIYEDRPGMIAWSARDESGAWTEPLAGLGMDGLSIGAVSLKAPLVGLDVPHGYYPSGLGLTDFVLWAKANGIGVHHRQCEVTGLPPWWDGASGQAEAEERLASHIAQLDFWWADLLHHIRKTGWW